MEPVPCLISVSIAKRYFKTTDVLGKTFLRPDKKKLVRHVIVGVTADSTYKGVREGPTGMVYLPLGKQDNFTLYVRSQKVMGDVVRIVEQEIARAGLHARVRQVTTLDTLVGNTLIREKLLAGLGGAFAGMSLLLAAIGVFGVLNYSVSRRTREIGIRAALGATRQHLVSLVAKDLVLLMGVGLAAGVAGALAVMPALRNLFFGIQRVDPAVMSTAAVCFLLIAMVAGGLPARRAASIDPNVALREE